MCSGLETLLRRMPCWYLLILVGLFLAGSRAFQWRADELGQPALDTRFGYTPEDVTDFLKKICPKGRRLYAATQLTLDLVFPLVYGAFLGRILVSVFRTELARYLLLIPLLAVAADWSENVATAILALNFNGEAAPPLLAYAAAGYTLTKWILLFAYGPILFAGLILALVRWILCRFFQPPPE